MSAAVARPRPLTEAEVRRAYSATVDRCNRFEGRWERLWELADEETRELMIKVSEQDE